MLVSMIGTVVVPVTAREVVVVVDVEVVEDDEVDDVDELVPGLALDFVPNAKNPLIIGVSSFCTGRRMSAPS